MAHQHYSCQVRQPVGAYPGVGEHDVQQGSLKNGGRLISILRVPLTLGDPRDNAPQSFAYRVI